MDICPCKTLRHGLLLLWWCVAASLAPAYADSQTVKPVPAACTQHCATPYGTVLGVAQGKVDAYSNCSAACVIVEPNQVAGTYTGIKWQCVEFARRWLLVNKGLVYGDVDVAADIWDRITYLTRVTDQKKIPLDVYPNGATRAPRPGDLLIYAREYLKTGHVAVITAVDVASQSVKVVEQNFANSRWPSDYARKLDLLSKDGHYWILDAYLLGWKSIQQ
ncbi:MAG: CHAP domain-containing protein [Gammaproteobacteria bacterium]